MAPSSGQVFQSLRQRLVKQARQIFSRVTGVPVRQVLTWKQMQDQCDKLGVEQLSALLTGLEDTPDTRQQPYARTVAPQASSLHGEHLPLDVEPSNRLLPSVADSSTTVSSTSAPQHSSPVSETVQSTGVTRHVPDSVQNAEDEPSRPFHDYTNSEYLKCVDQETIQACVVDFIEQTNNAAMAQSVCASCARLLFRNDMKEMPVSAIPHSHLLRPAKSHPAHVLSADGLLLAEGPHATDSMVYLCGECHCRLGNKRTPKLSLANGMWIGDIPKELQNLTLPERVLISLYFPVAYIVKLYPCGLKTLNRNQDRLHSAIKGNVSTYKLDQQQIADMITGHTMPPNPSILSSTIAITYVGPNNIPKKTLRGPFSVRRTLVSKALRWLKTNNPLYADIDISQERLDLLPEDGVPEQLEQTARWSHDVDRLNQEHAGYVPLLEEDEEETLRNMAREDDMLVDERIDEQTDEMEDHPRDIEPMVSLNEEPNTPAEVEAAPVIPLQPHGVIDIAGHDIPNDELFTHALANTAGITPSKVPKYDVRHGSAFINEYARKDPVTGLRFDGGPDNPNHLLGSFPFLFPYGKGGFETDQQEPVAYETHAQWAMQYHDRRFRRDPQFPFQVFGVIQKREVCRSAMLQISTVPDFIQNQLRSLKVQDFVKAVEEEARKVPFSNPAIRALRSRMTAIRARVTGTDESRHSIRGKIQATNLFYNSPTIWATLNPPDTQNPVAQVLVGEEIDLDKFCATAGPDATLRSVNIASDPFAAAQFFHHIIRCVLESLFGIKAGGKGGHTITRKEGIFGTVQAYIGAVEAQGRGTLHLHLLLWLKDTPTPSECREALKSEEFRLKVARFVQQNIHASIGDMTTNDFYSMKKQSEVSYARPLDPRHPDYDRDRKERLKHAVRSLQFHRCEDGVCKVFKRGAIICKRGAPWALARDAWVSEAGQWGPRRISGFINNFNPTIAETLTCNHDVKITLQGTATRALSWYITNYTSKKQQHTSNASALLARKFAFIEDESKQNPTYVDSNRRLLQRCANTLARDREFSGPEVMSYLMKWGDRYESHFYVNIYWHKAYSHLVKCYPGLKAQRDRDFEMSRPGWNSNDDGSEVPEEPEPEPYLLQFVGDNLELRDQLKEYAHRGVELEEECLIKVFLDTYDALFDPSKDDIDGISPLDSHTAERRGRRRHQRIPYLPSYGNPRRCRIRRAETHETLPRIIGRWFPRGDDPATKELHAACILVLLKPWRTMGDLKTGEETFSTTYEKLMLNAPKWMKTMVENIQHYYDCADQAKAEVSDEKNNMTYSTPLSEDLQRDYDIVFPHDLDESPTVTENDVELAREHRYPAREKEYLDMAMLVAQNSGLNVPAPHINAVVQEGVTHQTTHDLLPVIKEWEKHLKAITREQDGRITVQVDTSDPAAVLQSTNVGVGDEDSEARVTELVERVKSRPEGGLKDILNKEQRRAHDIIVGTVRNDVAGIPQKQLLMVVQGQGGTGKTMLIQAITESLKKMEASHLLGKAATSGIAASPIGGTTVHSYFGIPIHIQGRDWVGKASDAIKKRRKKNIASKRIIFIDEMSMLTKSGLCNISQVCQTVMAENAATASNSTLPFGGLHIILFGDLHQFPPVAASGDALYEEVVNQEKQRAALGREIFLQFHTVVDLKQQNRSRDPGWTAILNRSRVGECTEEDIEEVNKLSLTDPRCQLPDFNGEGWRDVILITPRHSLREEWNRHALRKFCHDKGRRRYIIDAHDINAFTGQKPAMEYRVILAGLSWKKTARLEGRIEIAKGMKIMVLMNIATEADVSNGTRGVIEDFWLHPLEEPEEREDGSIVLSRLPPVIFFRPDEPAAARFPGIAEGVIPITPWAATFEVKKDPSKKDSPSIKVKRTQYAITGAYAFTDYKSQGQTIEKVIIDLVIPKGSGGSISPFNAYVALSRGRGRDSIRLLRPLDSNLLTTHPSEALRNDVARLNTLDMLTTKAWECAVREPSTH